MNFQSLNNNYITIQNKHCPGFENDSRELQLNKWTKITSFLQLENYVSTLKILQVSHQNLFTSTGLNDQDVLFFEIKTLKNWEKQHEWPLAEKKAMSTCTIMS